MLPILLHSPAVEPRSWQKWPRLLAAIALTIAAFATVAAASPDRGHDKTIIGYYASWQWYDRDKLAAPAHMDFTKITRANFAFFQITEEGDIYGTDGWADPNVLFGPFDWRAADDADAHCSWDAPGTPPTCAAHHYEEGLLHLARAAGAEVYPSIGGWTLSAPFPAMAASARARRHFASQCVELIRNYGFDGIDLDWEYPGYEPHGGTPADRVNFNLLLDEVRAALDGLGEEMGQFYGLTAALPCGPPIIDRQDIAHVSRLLTELNLMTYDFHGSWNDATGANAPLYDQEGSPEFSVHGCVTNWLEGGAKREKINIGLPFYGRSFAKAKHLYESHEGSDQIWVEDDGVPQYYNILEKINEFTSVRDERTMTQYMYGDTGMVSYDDERAICDKTEYAQVHDLHGYIIWELSGDMNHDGSTPLLDAANAKLLNPDLDCAHVKQSDEFIQLTGASPEGSTPEIVPEVVPFVAPPLINANKPDLDEGVGTVVKETLMGMSYCTWSPDTACYPSSDGWPACCAEGAENCPKERPACEGDLALVPLTSLHSDIPNTKVTTALTTPATTAATTAANTTTTVTSKSPIRDFKGKFFPVFNNGTTICKKVGALPSWMTKNMLKETKSECCQNYAFHWDYEKCLTGTASDSLLSHTSSDRTEVYYYPNFESIVCHVDGNHFDWMAGDYLTENLRKCCRKSFQGTELARQCRAISKGSKRPTMNENGNKNEITNSNEDKDKGEVTLMSEGGKPSLGLPLNSDKDKDKGNEETEFNQEEGKDKQEDVEELEEKPSFGDKDKDKENKEIEFNKEEGKDKEEDMEEVEGKPSFVGKVDLISGAHAADAAKVPAARVLDFLSSKSETIDNELFLYETATGWLPSTIYNHDGLSKGLRVMNSRGVAGMHFYLGNMDEGEQAHSYGLTNVAAFLAQSMKETIKYNACSENNWDLIDGGYPVSNACGQLGQSYQDYKCPKGEEHMACAIDRNMEIKATTNAKWYGAPAPLFCQPKKSKTDFTGKWDYNKVCHNPWSDPPMECTDYEGQKGGGYDNEHPVANAAGRTDVEGCCWWGRGVIQTTGPCNFGKLNYYLGVQAAKRGEEVPYSSIDFCKDPEIICSSAEFQELKWVAGMFYWIESIQEYNVGGWSYMDELRKFVDGNFQDRTFIDSVSGIVNRGCHNPPCGTGPVDGGHERYNNFLKILKAFKLLG